MTYGVDQCRVCGKPIKPSDSEAMNRHLNAQRKKPLMTEPEWRAAGLKASPTARQMTRRHDGCCFDCQLPMGLRKTPMMPAFYTVLGIVLFLMITIFFIGSLFT